MNHALIKHLIRQALETSPKAVSDPTAGGYVEANVRERHLMAEEQIAELMKRMRLSRAEAWSEVAPSILGMPLPPRGTAPEA